RPASCPKGSCLALFRGFLVGMPEERVWVRDRALWELAGAKLGMLLGRPVSVAVPVGLDHDRLGEGAVGDGPGPAHDAARVRRGYAVLVRRSTRGHERGHLLGLEYGPLLLVHRPVDLDELAVGQLPDDAGLEPVLQQLLVLTLQTQADTSGDDKSD